MWATAGMGPAVVRAEGDPDEARRIGRHHASLRLRPAGKRHEKPRSGGALLRGSFEGKRRHFPGCLSQRREAGEVPGLSCVQVRPSGSRCERRISGGRRPGGPSASARLSQTPRQERRTSRSIWGAWVTNCRKTVEAVFSRAAARAARSHSALAWVTRPYGWVPQERTARIAVMKIEIFSNEFSFCMGQTDAYPVVQQGVLALSILAGLPQGARLQGLHAAATLKGLRVMEGHICCS